jgi:hypothetical protein
VGVLPTPAAKPIFSKTHFKTHKHQNTPRGHRDWHEQSNIKIPPGGIWGGIKNQALNSSLESGFELKGISKTHESIDTTSQTVL